MHITLTKVGTISIGCSCMVDKYMEGCYEIEAWQLDGGLDSYYFRLQMPTFIGIGPVQLVWFCSNYYFKGKK